MSFDAAVGRVAQILSFQQSLTGVSAPAQATPPTTGQSATTTAGASTSFASALAGAQATSSAAVPAGSAPAQVQAMTAAADSMLGKPYIWGGGHSGWAPQPGYDCSGFVSAVLHAGGYLSTPQDTTSLPSAAGMQAGPGQYVTVYDRAKPGDTGHVIININGQFYESGGEHGSWGGGGGVAKIAAPSAAYLATFETVLHPQGL